MIWSVQDLSPELDKPERDEMDVLNKELKHMKDAFLSASNYRIELDRYKCTLESKLSINMKKKEYLLSFIKDNCQDSETCETNSQALFNMTSDLDKSNEEYLRSCETLKNLREEILTVTLELDKEKQWLAQIKDQRRVLAKELDQVKDSVCHYCKKAYICLNSD